MPSFTTALIILAALGSALAFGLFFAAIITTNNPIIVWVQSVSPLQFLLVFVALFVLAAVLMLPKPRRR